jgi:hypothetical protein
MENTSDSNLLSKKDISYLSKDFDSYKSNLIKYIKTYYPKTYKDFSENSTGMMFVDLVSYVGDVLSYYIDYQFKEGFLQYATERKNILTLSEYLGYRPNASVAATTKLDIFQLVPSKISEDGKNEPDMKYALNIQEGMEVVSTGESSIKFRTTEPANFGVSDVNSPVDISVFQRDQIGQPTFYLLKKQVMASAGTRKTYSVSVGDAEEFFQIKLPDTDVLEINSIYDSDGNEWREVDFLSQDTVLIEEPNNEKVNPETSQYSTVVPYLLRYIKTSKRFTTRVNSDNTTTIEFGAGKDKIDEEIIIPSLNNVGELIKKTKGFEAAYDPSNFLKSDTYGEAPRNTVLEVDYYAGGGVESNLASNSLTTITNIAFSDSSTFLSDSEERVLRTIKNTVTVNNPDPALGGKSEESDEEIRIKGMASFASQNRAVTRDDYVIRAYSMPPRLGSIAKVFVSKDGVLDTSSQYDIVKNSSEIKSEVLPGELNKVYGEINNPFAINMYVLSYNESKKLTNPNDLVFENLSNYLSRYRVLTDGLNLTNAFIINIGVEFEVSSYMNYNKKELLLSVSSVISDFFDIDKWQISQSIDIGSLEIEISKVSGVKNVVNLRIKNLNINDGDYSDNEYDIESATRNKIIYPAKDPSIFELKYPNRDIVGRVL